MFSAMESFSCHVLLLHKNDNFFSSLHLVQWMHLLKSMKIKKNYCNIVFIYREKDVNWFYSLGTYVRFTSMFLTSGTDSIEFRWLFYSWQQSPNSSFTIKRSKIIQNGCFFVLSSFTNIYIMTFYIATTFTNVFLLFTSLVCYISFSNMFTIST